MICLLFWISFEDIYFLFAEEERAEIREKVEDALDENADMLDSKKAEEEQKVESNEGDKTENEPTNSDEKPTETPSEITENASEASIPPAEGSEENGKFCVFACFLVYVVSNFIRTFLDV